MAYRCIMAPSHECDGCMECKEYDEYRDEFEDRFLDEDPTHDADAWKEECYIRELERSEAY